MVKKKGLLLSGIVSLVFYSIILAVLIYSGIKSYNVVKLESRGFSISVNLDQVSLKDINDKKSATLLAFSSESVNKAILKDSDTKDSEYTMLERKKVIRNVLTKIKGIRDTNSSMVTDTKQVGNNTQDKSNETMTISDSKGVKNAYAAKMRAIMYTGWNPINMKTGLSVIVHFTVSSSGVLRYSIVKSNNYNLSLELQKYIDSLVHNKVFLKNRPKEDTSFNIRFKTK